jgi:hypothetical protein
LNFRTFTDWILPTLEPVAPSEEAKLAKIQSDYLSERDTATHGDVVAAEQWYSDEVTAYEAERTRGQGALDRLKIFLTVAPTSTILLALAGWAFSDALVALTYRSQIALSALATYVTVQLILVLRWATTGALSARIVHPLPVSVQQVGQAKEAYFRKKAAAVYSATCANTEENNYLISCRLVIKVCLRNFVSAALLCMVFAIIGVTYNNLTAEAETEAGETTEP